MWGRHCGGKRRRIAQRADISHSTLKKQLMAKNTQPSTAAAQPRRCSELSRVTVAPTPSERPRTPRPNSAAILTPVRHQGGRGSTAASLPRPMQSSDTRSQARHAPTTRGGREWTGQRSRRQVHRQPKLRRHSAAALALSPGPVQRHLHRRPMRTATDGRAGWAVERVSRSHPQRPPPATTSPAAWRRSQQRRGHATHWPPSALAPISRQRPGTLTTDGSVDRSAGAPAQRAAGSSQRADASQVDETTTTRRCSVAWQRGDEELATHAACTWVERERFLLKTHAQRAATVARW